MAADAGMASGGRHGRVARLAAFTAVLALLATSCSGDDGSQVVVSTTVVVDVERPMSVEIVAPSSCEIAGCVARGVDTSSGEFRTDSADLLVPSGLFAVELERQYVSGGSRPGWFGVGWSTVYETSISESGDVITIDAPVGLQPQWTAEAPDGWEVAGSVAVDRLGSAGGYTVGFPTGEVWTFNSQGDLARLSSPYGQVVDVVRLPDSVTISSTQGVALTLRLEGGFVRSATMSDGRSVEYTYTENRLTGVAAPGLAINYVHNADGLMIEEVLASGATSVEYEDGQVVAQRTPSGDRFEFGYGMNGVVVTGLDVSSVYEHDELGRLVRVEQGGTEVLTQSFDQAGRLVSRVERVLPSGQVASSTEREFAADGRLLSTTVDGLTSSFEYDELGRVTAVSGVSSTSFEYAASGPLPTVVITPETGRSEIEIDAGFTVAVTDATGATSLTRRDELGNPVAIGPSPDALWTFEFDAEGNIASSTSAMGRTWDATWGPRSTLLSQRDPLGRTSSFEYDSAGRIVRQQLPGGTTTYQYTSSGDLAATTEPDGALTRYEYSAPGRLAAIVRPGGRTWRVYADALADGSTKESTVAPDGSKVEQLFDSRGRVTSRRSLEADGSQTEVVTTSYVFGREVQTAVERGPSRLAETTVYDDEGRVVEETSILDGVTTARVTYQFANGRIVRVETLADTSTYSYDEAGRLVNATQGDEEWSAVYRDGRVSSVDHDGEITSISYDLDGRADTFVEPDGSEIVWTFDDADRPVSRTVADVPAFFSWNDGDQLVRYAPATGATWEWAYDEAGRMLEAVEPGETRTSYEYVDGDIVRIQSSGRGTDRDDRFTYGAQGLMASAETSAGSFEYEYDATGSIRSIRSSAGDESWILDAAGNVAGVTEGDDSYDISYTSDGNLESIESPTGRVLSVSRADGIITAIDADDDIALRLGVDNEGRLSSVDWGDDTIVDVDWVGAESFSVRTRGAESHYDYIVDNGRLTNFAADDTLFRATVQRGNRLDTLKITGEVTGTVQFDQLGRPATMFADNRVSSITYDQQGRVSSVAVTEDGQETERTTVTYEDGERRIDGDADLVTALFDESGGPRQPLPGDLANPLSSAVDEPLLTGSGLIAGAERLLSVQPDPFAQVAADVRQATPELMSVVGVGDRGRLARQLLVAEVNRLSPTVSIHGRDEVRVPIVDPESGEASQFNPFVDAAPSGLALGVLAREAGGGDSIFGQALGTLGDIVGGAVTLVGDVARFVISNPLAKRVLMAGLNRVASSVCSVPKVMFACIAARVVVFASGVMQLATDVAVAWRVCGSRQVANCIREGLSISQKVANLIKAPDVKVLSESLRRSVSWAVSSARGAGLTGTG